MLSDKVLLERNVIVRVKSLERNESRYLVDVAAERYSGLEAQNTYINWIVYPNEAKTMFIGQEFEVTIKPYIREELTNAERAEFSDVNEEATKEAAEYSEGS